MPILDPKKYPNIASGVERGGYVISDTKGGGPPDIILAASGSEVQLILEAQERLLSKGVQARAVSLPSWNLFDKQDEDYTKSVFTPGAPILSVEAGATLGWRPYIGPRIGVIGLERFGASAPGSVALDKLGFNTDNICKRALQMLEKGK
jgi:transketolase